MFDISLSELLLVFVVGTIVLKPKDLVKIIQRLSKFDKKLFNKAEDQEDFVSFNKANLFDQNNQTEKKK